MELWESYGRVGRKTEGPEEDMDSGRDRHEVPAGVTVAEGREEDGAQAGRQAGSRRRPRSSGCLS